MDTKQELEEALNANDTVFNELRDQLDELCKSLGLDPEKYSLYITVHEDAESTEL